jgi:sulfite reductase beta subunit-like hemoprotein
VQSWLVLKSNHGARTLKWSTRTQIQIQWVQVQWATKTRDRAHAQGVTGPIRASGHTTNSVALRPFTASAYDRRRVVLKRPPVAGLTLGTVTCVALTPAVTSRNVRER